MLSAHKAVAVDFFFCPRDLLLFLLFKATCFEVGEGRDGGRVGFSTAARLPTTHLSLTGKGWLVDRRDRVTTNDLTAPEERRGNTRTASSPRMLIGALVRDRDPLLVWQPF